MYNEGLKKQFLHNRNCGIEDQDQYVKLFESISSFEAESERDFCAMCYDDYVKIADHLMHVRSRSSWYQVSLLKNYVKWCLASNVENANDEFLRIPITGSSRLRKFCVASPTHLSEVLDAIFRPIEMNTIDNVYRGFLWLSYHGVKPEDLYKISNEDIDFITWKISYNERKIPIYREAFDVFDCLVHQDRFFYDHSNYGNPIFRDRYKSDILLRGIKSIGNVDATRHAIHKRNAEAIQSGKIEVELSPQKLALSGKFFEIFMAEISQNQSVFQMKLEMVTDDFLDGREYEFGKSNMTYSTKRNLTIRDFRSDYYRWKSAFNL